MSFFDWFFKPVECIVCLLPKKKMSDLVYYIKNESGEQEKCITKICDDCLSINKMRKYDEHEDIGTKEETSK